jgi:hypothetical protein
VIRVSRDHLRDADSRPHPNPSLSGTDARKRGARRPWIDIRCDRSPYHRGAASAPMADGSAAGATGPLPRQEPNLDPPPPRCRAYRPPLRGGHREPAAVEVGVSARRTTTPISGSRITPTTRGRRRRSPPSGPAPERSGASRPPRLGRRPQHQPVDRLVASTPATLVPAAAPQGLASVRRGRPAVVSLTPSRQRLLDRGVCRLGRRAAAAGRPRCSRARRTSSGAEFLASGSVPALRLGHGTGAMPGRRRVLPVAEVRSRSRPPANPVLLVSTANSQQTPRIVRGGAG